MSNDLPQIETEIQTEERRMNTKLLLKGFIKYEPTGITHQSALRIVQRTSWDKFLTQWFKGRLGKSGVLSLNRSSLKALLANWQKNLFVTSGASKELNAVKAIYTAHFRKAKMEVPKPFDGYLALHVVITFPWLKGATKKEKEECYAVLKNTKPDCDNLVKILQDSMENNEIIKNDSRFSIVYYEKRYGDTPGIYYRISQILDRKKRRAVTDDILD
jgi:Holliday junction resolvase RusA-like endonuclease